MKTTAWLCAALLCSGATLSAEEAKGPPFTLKPVGEKAWAALTVPRSGAGANAGFVVGDSAVLVVDTFETAEAARLLLSEIQKVTPLPVKYVVNTHYHLDHVVGNGVFVEHGAVVIAHQNVPGWIRTENLKFFGKDIKPEQRSLVEGLVPPQVTYSESVRLDLGGRTALVRFFPGHTGGDSVVTIPDAKVTFAGDLFWRETLPNLIDATTKAWIETLGELASSRPGDAFVPGHGGVGTAADVGAFRAYLTDLRGWVQASEAQGKSGEELVTDVLAQSKPKYGTWQFFDFFSRKNVIDVDAELRGTKRTPEAPRP
jgi:glyoxylase-like metal-dependent hydrolase (beta-lactamase superfamily II)